jgi:D-alanine-D-alanine ligase
MRVALVYNQKKEDAVQQSVADESSEPPSSPFGRDQNSTLQVIKQSPSILPNDIYAEWDSVETINAVRDAIAQLHDVTLIEADSNVYDKLRLEKPEIVFNIAEGLYGVSREAQIPALLEMLQIPYTGSDPLTLAICLDKSRAKEILSYYNIPTPKFHVISTILELDDLSMPFPLMVKPLHEGSSKGIYNTSVVATQSELKHEINTILKNYKEPALIEQYLDGREFTVAMLGNGDDLKVLPIVEIKFDSLPEGVKPIYSYEAKWIWDRADAPLDIFECPANISRNLTNGIKMICKKAYNILRCKDWCRIDVRLDSAGTPNIIELNPLPGILPNPDDNSCFPKAARAAGLHYNELIQSVLAIAAKRYGLVHFKSYSYQTQ